MQLPAAALKGVPLKGPGSFLGARIVGGEMGHLQDFRGYIYTEACVRSRDEWVTRGPVWCGVDAPKTELSGAAGPLGF